MNDLKTLYKLEPKKKFQTDFFVFDVETKIKKDGKDIWGLSARPDSFVFGVVYGRNYCRVIHNLGEFKEEFEKPQYKGKFVFAHNASYDLGILYDNIYKFDNKAIFNGKFIKASNGNAVFADSMNIYPMGLAKLGEHLGKSKGDILKEKLAMEKPIEYPISSEMINYCIRDCEIVYDALVEMFMLVGDIKLTLASLSMSYFRRHHMHNNIIYNKRLVKYFFNSYYGGRTEAFKIGKTDAKVYDSNSNYKERQI